MAARQNTVKYMGSKNRIAKHILPIILKDRKPGQIYYEPLVGGANLIDKVDGERVGADSNKYIAAMWFHLSNGWVMPENVDKDLYKHIKNNKHEYLNHVVGWVGIACSYSGKWFGGFAGKVETKSGLRDYQAEAVANVKKQIPGIIGVEFIHSHYKDLEIKPYSIIYCDPPYANTTKYKDDFNHAEFWQWCRDKANRGHQVFISEYNAPNDFVCLWEKEVKSSLSANGKSGSNKNSVERLFTYK